MSARDDLLDILYDEGEHEDTREATADRILARHAHELAEKQRQGAQRIYDRAMELDPDLAVKANIAMQGIIGLLDLGVE